MEPLWLLQNKSRSFEACLICPAGGWPGGLFLFQRQAICRIVLREARNPLTKQRICIVFDLLASSSIIVIDPVLRPSRLFVLGQ